MDTACRTTRALRTAALSFGDMDSFQAETRFMRRGPRPLVAEVGVGRIARDIFEKGHKRAEAFVLPAFSDNKVRFGAVILEGVDQAVKEVAFEEGAASVAAFSDCRTQAGDREVFAEGGEPVFDILTTDGDAVLAGGVRGGLLKGVEAVVFGDGVQDHAQGKTFMFVDERGEFLFAVAAVEELHVAILVLADAFADDAAGAAVRTGDDGFGFVEGGGGHGVWYFFCALFVVFFVRIPGGFQRVVRPRVWMGWGPAIYGRPGAVTGKIPGPEPARNLRF